MMKGVRPIGHVSQVLGYHNIGGMSQMQTQMQMYLDVNTNVSRPTFHGIWDHEWRPVLSLESLICKVPQQPHPLQIPT